MQTPEATAPLPTFKNCVCYTTTLLPLTRLVQSAHTAIGARSHLINLGHFTPHGDRPVVSQKHKFLDRRSRNDCTTHSQCNCACLQCVSSTNSAIAMHPSTHLIHVACTHVRVIGSPG